MLVQPGLAIRYSFIDIYSNKSSSALPFQSIRANSLFIIDASGFKAFDGLFITINVAGTFTPFHVRNMPSEEESA